VRCAFEWNRDGNGEARLLIGALETARKEAAPILEAGLKKTKGQKQWVRLNFDCVAVAYVLFKIFLYDLFYLFEKLSKSGE
jgi:hypothetical protein